MKNSKRGLAGSLALLILVVVLPITGPAWGADKINIVMLMTDDTGWNDFGAYSGGGAGLGHAQMQSGEIDRTQLTPDYSAQLTDAAVQGMSRYLREYEYGVSPTGAEVLQARRSGDQTMYVVKLLFPRGDAASLLLGFNAKNQITGVSLLSMAGD